MSESATIDRTPNTFPIFGFKRAYGNEDAKWFGKVHGHDRNFIRCCAGVSMPILDRALGAVFVVAELYRVTAPPDLWIVGHEVGDWIAVQGAMTQFRRDLKFAQIITDCEEARVLIRRMREVYYALSEIPVYTDIAPGYALSEVGRSTVDQMFNEGRLHADETAIERLDEEAAARALQSVVCYMKEWPALYKPTHERLHGMRNIIGTEGL